VITATAVAAGAGVIGVPTQAEASTTGPDVALGPTGTTAVEFRGRITQSGTTGQSFTSTGYVTAASNARTSDLFDGTTTNETTALLTVFSTGNLVARTLDQSVHSLDIVGTMTVYQRSSPGASFSDPSSFQDGTPVARYTVTIQDVLTVFATGMGLPTLTGDMRQTSARSLSGPLAGGKFGRVGTRLRMFATGLGTLTDASAPHSQLEVAGNWSIE
jgi:hypothetical protein